MIDTTLVEANEFDDAMPYTGRITSDWYVDGEIVEYLGNMTALPQDIQDRGLAQECWGELGRGREALGLVAGSKRQLVHPFNSVR